jgi:hypothetical protein
MRSGVPVPDTVLAATSTSGSRRRHELRSPVPFTEILIELLRESDFTTSSGRPNLAAFAEVLDGVSYESLRKVIAGERAPTKALIEACAAALRVPPDSFVEYRLLEARLRLDPHRVGLVNAVNALHSMQDPHTDEGDDDVFPLAPDEAFTELNQLIKEAETRVNGRGKNTPRP